MQHTQRLLGQLPQDQQYRVAEAFSHAHNGLKGFLHHPVQREEPSAATQAAAEALGEGFNYFTREHSHRLAFSADLLTSPVPSAPAQNTSKTHSREKHLDTAEGSGDLNVSPHISLTHMLNRI